MKNFDRAKFSHYVRFSIALLAMQLVIYFVRVIFFSGIFAQAVEDARLDGNQIPRIITIALSLFAIFVFCVISSRGISGDTEKRKVFLDEAKKSEPTFKSLFDLCFKKNLTHTIIFAALQVPYLIFYSFFGLVYGFEVTHFELFYTLEAGFYEITRIGIVGFIISCVVFLALQMIFEIMVYRRWNMERIL